MATDSVRVKLTSYLGGYQVKSDATAGTGPCILDRAACTSGKPWF